MPNGERSENVFEGSVALLSFSVHASSSRKQVVPLSIASTVYRQKTLLSVAPKLS
jgi:hypothetical protein